MQKIRINGLLSLGCLFPAFILAGTAKGAMIQYQLSGVVVEIFDRHHELDGIVQVGDPYTVVFSFDADTPDGFPEDPRLGGYPGSSATMVLNELNVQAASCGLSVENNYRPVGNNMFSDGLSFHSYASSYYLFQVIFDDPTGTLLTGERFPTISEIETFAPGQFKAYVGNAEIYGSAAIPEPGTLSLLFAGMLAFWMRRRNR